MPVAVPSAVSGAITPLPLRFIPQLAVYCDAAFYQGVLLREGEGGVFFDCEFFDLEEGDVVYIIRVVGVRIRHAHEASPGCRQRQAGAYRPYLDGYAPPLPRRGLSGSTPHNRRHVDMCNRCAIAHITGRFLKNKRLRNVSETSYFQRFSLTFWWR